MQEDLLELKELAKSAGTDPVYVVTGSRKKPDPKYFVGKGKLEELKGIIEAYEADIVLFNHPLSPSQERNLEGFLGVRVVDRNGLILDIFAQRAQTFEGKLQVELAQLQHLSTRLVRGWTHLERQKGGIGLRGPGETQLETDRRLLGLRIKQIQQRLDKVDKQRHQGRSKRKKAEVPAVSLVGYTNAGKSTLFNRLTAPISTWRISCSPPWIRPCATVSCPITARLCWPIRWALYGICRMSWSRRLSPRCRKPAKRIYCCM